MTTNTNKYSLICGIERANGWTLFPPAARPFRIFIEVLMLYTLIAGSARALPAVHDAIEQWDFFELALSGPSTGNPFIEVDLTAQFTNDFHTISVRGFYDGGGLYKIRFMPETTGEWHYTTSSNLAALDHKSGIFIATPPEKGNHGPVRVHNTFHFIYSDGTPFNPFGTTCYVWTHQGDALEEQTLRTLASSPFNKIRFCIFPKNYVWNHNNPIYYPFDGDPPTNWDFTRPNTEYYKHFELRVRQLRDLGIEADIILFHPYDQGRWGFDRMGAANDDRYVRYVVARLSAFRNVWWSLANEYDLIKGKQTEDWDRLFKIVQSEDPYQHLRSIHQDRVYYNHSQPWITHVSVQNASAASEFGRAMIYRDIYKKPVIFDEVRYEGNISSRFGDLSPQELMLRFWMGTVAGTYVGHGETFASPDEVLWWSKGGVLHGQSAQRIAFLRQIVEDAPPFGINPIDAWQELGIGGKAGEYYLAYFGREPRTSWKFELFGAGLHDGMRFSVDVIDTWKMTITPMEGIFQVRKRDSYFFEDVNGRSVPLPGVPYVALRIRVKR